MTQPIGKKLLVAVSEPRTFGNSVGVGVLTNIIIQDETESLFHREVYHYLGYFNQPIAPVTPWVLYIGKIDPDYFQTEELEVYVHD